MIDNNLNIVCTTDLVLPKIDTVYQTTLPLPNVTYSSIIMDNTINSMHNIQSIPMMSPNLTTFTSHLSLNNYSDVQHCIPTLSINNSNQDFYKPNIMLAYDINHKSND
ncbi:unnamed protein product [Schistosoma spindalis]|nr:unnamed protein product [Schistosoma spindale]